MSRILFTWELGQNFGHLARILPVATALQTRGHEVLVAVREVPAAAALLRSAAVPFVPAPLFPVGLPPAEQLNNYADLLLSQGWRDVDVLGALVRAWQTLFTLFRPDMIVHTHSPTAQLAAQLTGIRSIRYGNGFEVVPEKQPLPTFQDMAWVSATRASAADHLAVCNANHVAAQLRAVQFSSLAACLKCHHDFIVSLPELDHYGLRDHVTYLMPCFPTVHATRIDWPSGEGACVFAYVRPDTPHVASVLQALKRSSKRVVCVASGFRNSALAEWQTSRMRCVNTPVDLRLLLQEAALCISFGAEGTLTRFLLAGVPQLVIPSHLENLMLAHRVDAAQVGRYVSTETLSESAVKRALTDLLESPEYRTQAQQFQYRYKAVTGEECVNKTVMAFEQCLSDLREIE